MTLPAPNPRKPVLVRAEGLHVWDADGRRYLDATSGAFCVSLGYTRPDIVRVMADAASRLPHARPSAFESEESVRYREEVLAAAGAPYSRVVLTGSGSEAVEAAIKMAWRVQAARGHPGRRDILSLEGHFHGATLGALDVTGLGTRRGPYEALLGPRAFGPPADCPRCFRALRHPGCEIACANAALERAGVAAAFLAETIPASGLGAPVPPPGWLARVRRRCDEAGALWIADEVLAGFGRAGDLFAWRRLDADAVPDFVVFGKGAGAGFAAIAGVLVSERVAAALEEGASGGGFAHHQTHGGNPIACAVGRRVLEALAEERVIEGVREAEATFTRALDPLRRHPRVLDVRGLGFLRGIALRDEGAREAAAGCRARGVLVHAAEPGALLLAPPLIAREAEFEEIAGALAASLG
ncbi:MAG TPA: aminotransferase class III-fold pyridoxal phosphate-dependent enzyme [Candidatus Eisenbacteria bacterium]